MCKWAKRNTGILVGLFCSAIYSILIILLCGPNGGIEFLKAADPNETGDFLAGIFAPLAFAWLVAGLYMQKGELQLQREQLASQNDQIKLQTAEMRASVEEARALTESTEEQIRIQKAVLQPFFHIYCTTNIENRGTTPSNYRVRNLSASAAYIVTAKPSKNQPDMSTDNKQQYIVSGESEKMIDGDSLIKLSLPPSMPSFLITIRYQTPIGGFLLDTWELLPDQFAARPIQRHQKDIEAALMNQVVLGPFSTDDAGSD